MKKFDVIIIGCGPAGVAAAKTLINNNINFCMIDKAKFPRKKLCAGGLTNKCVNLLNELEFNFKNIPYNEITKLSIRSNNKVYILNLNDPAISVDRTQFDNNNLNYIKKYTNNIFENEQVKEITDSFVITEKDNYEYSYVIFADGVNGISRKYTNKILGFCVESDIKGKTNNDNVLLSFDNVKYGYSWIFPKQGFNNIGMGKFRCLKDNYKDMLIKFCNESNIEANDIKLFGFHIPVFKTKRNLVVDNNKLLTGDAFGFVDPVTGEGIYYALLSGKIAAESIVQHMNCKNIKLKNIYKKNLKKVIKRLNSRKILNIIFYSPLRSIIIKILFINKQTKKFLENMFN